MLSGPPILTSPMLWHRPDDRSLNARLRLDEHCPAIVAGTFAGYQQCNAMLYRLLSELTGRRGFIHLPPQDAWMERTDGSDGEYAEAFAKAVRGILADASWVSSF